MKEKEDPMAEREDFGNFIRDMDLMIPPLHGKKFTWSNKRENSSFAKLDRFSFSTQWSDTFPSIQKD